MAYSLQLQSVVDEDTTPTSYGKPRSDGEHSSKSSALASSRSCRSLLVPSPSSFDVLYPPNCYARIRRLIMVVSFALQIVITVLSILSAYRRKSKTEIILYFVLAIPSLWLAVVCLAIIGDAAGNPASTNRLLVSRVYGYSYGDSLSSYIAKHSSDVWMCSWRLVLLAIFVSLLSGAR